MHLNRVRIQNFRGLEDITVEFTRRANVIVGPNAIGKTTILEAIRLAKAVLAPRIPDEAQKVLTALGAFSPHTQQELHFAALERV